MTTLPRFGLNRFDSRSVDHFAADVARAEQLGWDAALQPDSQLRRRDTYVLLAAAARVTQRITLGPLLANPVNRHPSVTASSIATVDELAPGRVLLGWGVGDTAVRLAGLKPAKVAELESSTRLMRALLDGREVEVGAARPARLPHHRPVPLWIAAGGPRTLRMAGGVADGVFIRVGTHPPNIATAVEASRAGAVAAGSDPAAVRRGARSSRRRGSPGADRIRRRSSTPEESGPTSTTRSISRRAVGRWTSCPRRRRTPSACAAAPRRWRASSWRRSAARPPRSTTWCCTRSRIRAGPTIPSAGTRPGSRAKSCRWCGARSPASPIGSAELLVHELDDARDRAAHRG